MNSLLFVKLRSFLHVVPKAVRILAAISVVAGTVFAGLVAAGFLFGHAGDGGHRFAGLGLGGMVACIGLMPAVWFLFLGYVYADARRRAMPPIAWTLISAFAPYLLGFLLYFALRRPVASACANCGQATMSDRPFCSWCGHPQPPTPTGGPQFRPGSPGESGPHLDLCV